MPRADSNTSSLASGTRAPPPTPVRNGDEGEHTFLDEACPHSPLSISLYELAPLISSYPDASMHTTSPALDNTPSGDEDPSTIQIDIGQLNLAASPVGNTVSPRLDNGMSSFHNHDDPQAVQQIAPGLHSPDVPQAPSAATGPFSIIDIAGEGPVDMDFSSWQCAEDVSDEHSLLPGMHDGPFVAVPAVPTSFHSSNTSIRHIPKMTGK